MLIDETINRIRELTAKAHEGLPEGETIQQPVLGAPPWFLSELRDFYSEPAESEVEELCGAIVAEDADLAEPVLVFADGTHYTPLPGWARRAILSRTATDDEREAFARKLGVSGA
jgi:hypothetical protein